jgi:hypothetical protein
MGRISGLFTAMGALFLQACGTPVLVVDPAGNPIGSAKIAPVSQSINYPTVNSNARGRAYIPRHIQEVEWIDVSKEGYRPQKEIQFRRSIPIIVELIRGVP